MKTFNFNNKKEEFYIMPPGYYESNMEYMSAAIKFYLPDTISLVLISLSIYLFIKWIKLYKLDKSLIIKNKFLLIINILQIASPIIFIPLLFWLIFYKGAAFGDVTPTGAEISEIVGLYFGIAMIILTILIMLFNLISSLIFQSIELFYLDKNNYKIGFWRYFLITINILIIFYIIVLGLSQL